MRRLLFASLLVAGCFTVTSEIELNSDGGGEARISVNTLYMGDTVSTDSLMASSQLLRRLGENPGVQLLRMDSTVDTSEMTVEIWADYRFRDITQFLRDSALPLEVHFRRSGGKRTLEITVSAQHLPLEVKPQGTTQEDSLVAAMEGLSNMLFMGASFDLVLRVPGELVSHNGDSLRNGRIYWSAPFFVDTTIGMEAEKTLRVVFKP